LYFGPILLKKKDDLLKLKLDKEINEFKNIVTLLPKNKFIKKIKLKIMILIFQKIKKTF
jgi:tRNA A22 N-methylase